MDRIKRQVITLATEAVCRQQASADSLLAVGVSLLDA